MLIRGASFIVTGGGSGLGAATVRALVEAGGRVTIADLNMQAGEEIARGFGSDARFVKADVADGEEGRRWLPLPSKPSAACAVW